LKFTHLHSHTEASIADGLFGPKAWVGALKDKGFKSHAITDHGVMTSLLPFYSLMKQEKMMPILGVEFYYNEDPTKKDKDNRKNSHLILLAKDYDGYQNLCKLSKLSFTEGYYYKNRIGLEWLKQYKDGLICLTACMGGVLSQEVWKESRGEDSDLEGRFDQFSEIFGDDFYVEFQGHNVISSLPSGELFNSQALINQEFYDRLRTRKGFKQVVTNDCHYILPEHAMIQATLKDMSWKGGAKDGAGDSATVSKESKCDSLWLKKPIDIAKSFKEHHEYLPMKFVADGMLATQEILEKCSKFALPTGKRYLPTFKKDKPSKDLFKLLATKKLKSFLDSEDLRATRKEYISRFKEEYRVISTYGLEDYFLIVWDIVRYAETKGIYVGLGRGSAAGCLISYLLGIVKIDPLEYGLLFERFLNENRCVSGELPDIDLDFESDRRGEIKKYIFEKYGSDYVCEIGTYGRMKLKTSLIDFGKALGVATQKELHAITTNLDLDKEDVDDLDAAIESDPRLKKLVDSSEEYGFIVREIIGQIKSQGVHPAGLVICSEKIADITPVKTQKKTLKTEERVDGEPKDKRIITTQSEDKYIIANGMMKMDILGLKEYDVIKYVIENAGTPFTFENYKQEIQKQERIKPNKKVWQMFQKGKTEGVFQFASDGMKELLIQMRPDSINDLIAANALFRPGCLENGWHTQYCRRKHGEEEVEYVHPDVEAALGETYGVIVYQEQFMAVIHRLGGISLVDSDTIRSALGKKDKAKLDKFREQFVKGASERIGTSAAEGLWSQIEKAAGYTFNKSHSAAYSVLAYTSQYLKVHYPAHFWAAQLDWDIRKGKTDDMLVNRRAASEMGIAFVLPNVNRSKTNFYVEDKDVVWPISAVKGCGPKAAEEIVAKQPFTSFEDFHKRINKAKVKVNVIEALICSGAMDEFGDRKDLLKQLSDHGKKRFKPLTDDDIVQRFFDSMGFFERKIKDVRETFSDVCITEAELREYEPGEHVRVGGMIVNVRATKTKRGDAMGFATLMDLDEMIDLTFFPETWAENRELIRDGSIVEVGGRKSSWGNKENAIEVEKIHSC
jgi:DNA polymerase-3 subunit alpha